MPIGGLARAESPGGRPPSISAHFAKSPLSRFVDIGGLKYSLWSNITVPAGGKTIITQMSRFNFDSSEAGGFGCHDPLSDIPVIHVTRGGVTTDYFDSQEVLNTTGRDTGVCVYVGPIIEEGHDWVPVS